MKLQVYQSASTFFPSLPYGMSRVCGKGQNQDSETAEIRLHCVLAQSTDSGVKLSAFHWMDTKVVEVMKFQLSYFKY